MKRLLTSALLGVWLSLSPAVSYASGAGLLIPSATGARLSPLPTGSPPTFNQVTTNTGSTGVPNAAFISSPAVGDWLVAVETVGSFTPAMTSGWTDVETLTPCATAPVMLVAYHQVQPGDGAVFSPASAAQSGVWAMSIADVGTSSPSWANLEQQIAGNCASTIGAAVTVSGNGPRNTGVFATGYANVPTSGNLGVPCNPPTMTGVTGLAENSCLNGGGGSAAGIVAAEGILTGSSMFPVASATVSCPSGSTNCSEAYGVLIFLNP